MGASIVLADDLGPAILTTGSGAGRRLDVVRSYRYPVQGGVFGHTATERALLERCSVKRLTRAGAQDRIALVTR
ncbi:hypothetical protein [Elioraea sp.]|uniref:hypothetical protein n=1 Tax=Elioraea sp. TaxID=2185103 RepID=UPI003F70A8A9